MLVDAQGDEVTIDENEVGSPKLTRGLVAQGFYEVSTLMKHYNRYAC